MYIEACTTLPHPTYKPTHIHMLILYLPPPNSLSLSHTHVTHSLLPTHPALYKDTHSLYTHTHTHTHRCALSHTHTLSLALTLSHTHTNALSLTHTLSLALTLSIHLSQ